MVPTTPGTAIPAPETPGARAITRSRPAAGPAAKRARIGIVHRWGLPASVLACHLLAAVLNAPALASADRPTPAGVAGSVAYLAAWLVYAFRAGSCRWSAPLRRLAAFWAAAVAGAVIAGSVLRQDVVPVGAGPGAWLAAGLLFAVAAPMYGIAGLVAAEPVTGLVATGIITAAAVVTAAALRRNARGRNAPGEAAAAGPAGGGDAVAGGRFSRE